MKPTLLLFALAVVASTANAASVTLTEGRIDLTLLPFSETDFEGNPVAPTTAAYDVGLNEMETHSLVGHGGAGLAEVEYAAFETEAGAEFAARVVARSGSADQDGGGAATVFSVTFSLEEDTAYRFEADVEGWPWDFSALLDDELASASVDLEGVLSGTMPTFDDEGGFPIGFGTYVSAGVLSAGTHTFSVTAGAGLSRSYDGLATEGIARLTLGEAPVMIPTPAAGVLGIAVLTLTLLRRGEPVHL